MPYPAIYSPSYSYTDYSTAQGDGSFPGQQIDNDIAGLSASLHNLARFVQGTMRSDGELQNGIVTFDSLSVELQASGLAPAENWEPGENYVVGRRVVAGAGVYRATVAHTSGASFDADLASGLWALYVTLPPGPQGEQGPQGPQGDAGPAAWAAPELWETGHNYTSAAPRSVAVVDGETYVALADHVSGVFATDLANGLWVKVASRGPTGPGTGDMLRANNLSDVDNKAAALENLGVTLKGRALLAKSTEAEMRSFLSVPTIAEISTSFINDLARGHFHKSNWESSAFTRTGNDTARTASNILVEIGGVIYSIPANTNLSMPTLAAGTDYFVYACADEVIRVAASASAPSGYSGAFTQIGGFHYAPGGNATGYNTGGNTTPQINPRSMWDIKFRPAATDTRGWALNLDGRSWISIYNLIVDHIAYGPSRYNLTAADGASPPKVPTVFGGNGTTTYGDLTAYTANECWRAYGAELASVDELMIAAYGVLENTTIGSDPVNTIWDAPRTSMIGATGVTGHMWSWTRNKLTRWDGVGGWAWRDVNGGRGKLYIGGDVNLVTAVFGGSYAETAANCGSRMVNWSTPPWNSYGSFGARGRCDHLCLV